MSLNIRIDLETEIGPFSPTPGRNKSVTLEVSVKGVCAISWAARSYTARERERERAAWAWRTWVYYHAVCNKENEAFVYFSSCLCLTRYLLPLERLGFAFNDGERAVQGRLSSSEIGPEAVGRRLRLILAGKEGTREELSRFIESKFPLFERERERDGEAKITLQF